MARAVGVVGDAANSSIPIRFIISQIAMPFVVKLSYMSCEIAVCFRLAPRQLI